MNPYDKAHELARAIKSSEEMKKYHRLKKKVEEDAATKEMYENFSSKQIELQTKQMMGQTISEEEQKSLQRLYQIVSMHQDIMELLEAEQRLGVLLGDIQKIIGEAVSE